MDLSRSELVVLWRLNSDRSQGNKTMERRQVDLTSRKRLLAKMLFANVQKVGAFKLDLNN